MTWTAFDARLAKFWSRVSIPAGRGWEKKCWIWEGALTTDRPGTSEGGYGGGYGCLTVDGIWYRAHRYIYGLIHGVGLVFEDKILHSCDNRKCVNPAHLSCGTLSANLKQQYERGRR